jgi:hypothetical protein
LTGNETGTFHLAIKDGACAFHLGEAIEPALTIETPADVWSSIASGEISGRSALLRGQYSVRGDAELLSRMDEIFRRADDEQVGSLRPPGPIPLAGHRWMLVAFVPWLILWVTPGLLGVTTGAALGTALVAAAALVIYRQVFGSLTWFEIGSLVAIAALALVWWFGGSTLEGRFDVLVDVALGSVWLSSLVFKRTPLTTDYSRWRLRRELWGNSTFLHINGFLTHMWGWMFVLFALLSGLSLLLPHRSGEMTMAHYALLAAALGLTAFLPRRARSIRITDPERAARRRRVVAGVGLAVAVGLVAASAGLP